MRSPCGRRSLVADGPYPWSSARVRLMSSTPAEFRRAMVQALGAAVSDDADGLLVCEGGVRLHFALSSVEAARIGALQLNTLRVEISVLQGAAGAASGLLARIDRATQRGGG